jgi:phosphatidylglycerophosphate synthase
VLRDHGAGEIPIHGNSDDRALKSGNLEAGKASLRWSSEAPPEGAPVLRTDRVYDPRRLRRVLRSGGDPETAVLWRLDRAEDLLSASEELERRTSYQPLGSYWAWPLARGFARALRPTPIRPNAVTLAAAACMLAAAWFVAAAGDTAIARLATASLLALALVLDTADGHLARLQGTASAFGRWLDAVLDELCDAVLHGAIGWSMYVQSRNPAWLVAAIAYVAGKYLFVISCQNMPRDDARSASPDGARDRRAKMRSIVRLLGHADVRWHAWIVLAALGRMELALLAYVAYFPARVMASAARWMLRHG